MLTKKKFLGLFFLTTVIISLFLLAISLSNLHFQPGMPFPGDDGAGNSTMEVIVFPVLNMGSTYLLQGILAIVFITLVVYLSIRLIGILNWKTFFRIAAILALVLVGIYLLPSTELQPSGSSPGGYIPISTPIAESYNVSPLGRPPQLITWMLIAVLIGFAVLPVVLRLRSLRGQANKESLLLQPAETAMEALNSGADLTDVILRCYLQMTEAVQVELGIERAHTMTVREFEDWLQTQGFPIVPVHRLTTLFEKVRYGSQQLGKPDELLAAESLNDIVRFCKSSRGVEHE